MRTFIPRRALVFGATGLVGRALVGQLVNDINYGEVHLLVRRPVDDLPQSPRLSCSVVDFEKLPERLPAVDDVYCCIGTTRAQAGSRSAFRKVDLDLVVEIARDARRRGAERLGVISAAGADPDALFFYNRVKGEMERAVAQLGYSTLVIVRPSLLAGDRALARQPPRWSERLALAAAKPFAERLPAQWRPISAETVALALRTVVASGPFGVRLVSSAEMQTLAA